MSEKNELQHALHCLNVVLNDPESHTITLLLLNLQERLHDRGKVPEYIADMLQPHNIAQMLREHYKEDGVHVANEDLPSSSSDFNNALSALHTALLPVSFQTDPEIRMHNMLMLSKLIASATMPNGGPLSSILNAASRIETVDSEQKASQARGMAYLESLGIEVSAHAPRTIPEMVTGLHQELRALEDFKQSLHNEGRINDLTQLISCYQKISGLTQSPDTVVAFQKPKKGGGSSYLDSLHAINAEMKAPLTRLAHHYRDDAEFVTPLLNVHSDALDIIKELLLEKHREASTVPHTSIDAEGRTTNADRVTPPPAPERDK